LSRWSLQPELFSCPLGQDLTGSFECKMWDCPFGRAKDQAIHEKELVLINHLTILSDLHWNMNYC